MAHIFKHSNTRLAHHLWRDPTPLSEMGMFKSYQSSHKLISIVKMELNLIIEVHRDPKEMYSLIPVDRAHKTLASFYSKQCQDAQWRFQLKR